MTSKHKTTIRKAIKKYILPRKTVRFAKHPNNICSTHLFNEVNNPDEVIYSHQPSNRRCTAIRANFYVMPTQTPTPRWCTYGLKWCLGRIWSKVQFFSNSFDGRSKTPASLSILEQLALNSDSLAAKSTAGVTCRTIQPATKEICPSWKFIF